MSRLLIQIKDRFYEWSTIVDAPVTYGMTEPELRYYIKKEYGNTGLKELPKRLEQCRESGTSSQIRQTLDDVLLLNRAGPNERCLTADEIYAEYTYPKNLGPLPTL